MSKIQIVWFRDLQTWSVALQNAKQISSKFDLVKLSKVLIDLTKSRTFIIKDNKFYQEPTISSKTNLIAPRKQGIGKEFKVKKRVLILPNDLVIAKMHTQNGLYAIAKETFASTTTFIPFEIIENKINKDFLFIILKTTLQRLQKFDSVNRETYTTDEILDLQIPLPPLEIQNKIVADIHAIQTKIKALQVEEKRLKDEIETYIYITLGLQKPQSVQKQKVFVVRFKNLERWDTTYNQNKTINLYSSNTKFSKSKYPLVALGEICTTNVGLTYEPKNISNTKQGIAVLRSNNIQNGKIDYNDLVYVDNTDIPNNKIANKGDLIICVRNGSANLVGKTAMIEKNGMSFGAFMAIIRSKYNPYLYHFLQTDIFRNSVFEARTSGINQISQSDIKKFKIPLPPLQIQKEMVKNIEQKTSQISKMSQERIALQNSIESQLQKMLID